MMIRILSFGFFLLAAVVVLSAGPRKTDNPPDALPNRGNRAPWAWTTAERVTARRDPLQRLDRLRTADANRALEPKSLDQPKPADLIDGATHPELFFPSELFEHLVTSGFVALPQAYPEVVRQRSSDLFRERRDWDRLGVIVNKYVEFLKADRAGRPSATTSRGSENSTRCKASADALEEARRTFGRDRFDRMLYEAVAPSLYRTFSVATDLEKVIEVAVSKERRCK